MSSETCFVDSVHDLIIIGAGPCGLALAARLAERSPAALYTDVEHSRMQWLQARSQHHKAKGKKRFLVDRSAKCPSGLKNVLVLDASAPSWLVRWKTGFEQLDIRTLRSPLHFHPAPGDNDALRSFADAAGRHDETTEVRYTERQRKTRRSLMTRERQINERDRRDYRTASTSLFSDFTSDLVERYRLGPLVQQTEVLNIVYGQTLLHARDGTGVQAGFCLETTAGRLGAKAVVIACGNTGLPSIPSAFDSTYAGDEGGGWTHSSRFLVPDIAFPPAPVSEAIRAGRQTKMVVIGGGLTSAQITDLALARGVSHVTLVCRSKLKVKPFDVPIEWVAKFSSLMKAIFWQTEDMSERLAMIKDARRGGSITPAFSAILQAHVTARRLTLLTKTSADRADYDGATGSWTLDLVETTGQRTTLTDIDHVVLATGSRLDIDALPFLSSLREAGVLRGELGFPVLTSDLQASDETGEIPLFFAGAYAALQLGPGAMNLSGAREGAERIAHRLAALGVLDGDDSEQLDGRQALAALTLNHFTGLEVE